MNERRKHNRKEQEKADYPVVWFKIQDFIAPSDSIQGKIIDISKTGLGLATDIPLQPGQFIKFNDRRNKSEFPEAGIIMWTAESHEGFQAGVKKILSDI